MLAVTTSPETLSLEIPSAIALSITLEQFEALDQVQLILLKIIGQVSAQNSLACAEQIPDFLGKLPPQSGGFTK